MSVCSKWLIVFVVSSQVACTTEPKEIIIYNEDWEVVEHQVEETGPRLTQTGGEAAEATGNIAGCFLTLGFFCPPGW